MDIEQSLLDGLQYAIRKKIAFVLAQMVATINDDYSYMTNSFNKTVGSIVRELLKQHPPFSILVWIKPYEEALLYAVEKNRITRRPVRADELSLSEEDRENVNQYFTEILRGSLIRGSFMFDRVPLNLPQYELVSPQLRAELYNQHEAIEKRKQKMQSIKRSLRSTQDFPSRMIQSGVLPDIGFEEQEEFLRLAERPSRFSGGVVSRFPWLEPEFRNTLVSDQIRPVSRVPYSSRMSDGSRKKSSARSKRYSR